MLVSGSDLTEEEVAALLQEGEAKSPSFAKDKGIIHEIEEPVLPRDALLLQP